MSDRNRFGVEGEALAGVVWLAVFAVAGNGVAKVGKVDAYLVFSAGEEVYLKEAKGLGFFYYLVSGLSEFAFCGIGGRIDDVAGSLGKIGCDEVFFF